MSLVRQPTKHRTQIDLWSRIPGWVAAYLKDIADQVEEVVNAIRVPHCHRVVYMDDNRHTSLLVKVEGWFRQASTKTTLHQDAPQVLLKQLGRAPQAVHGSSQLPTVLWSQAALPWRIHTDPSPFWNGCIHKRDAKVASCYIPPSSLS
eukprot:6486729-Amphidinium_carterae.2